MNELMNKRSQNKQKEINLNTKNITNMQLGQKFMTKQSQYLFIKQKLDSYNISTTFPLQMMPLLQLLITRLDQQVIKSKPINSQQANKPINTSMQPSFSNLQPALKHQVQRILTTNNTLHMQLITHKQQIQSLKHCIDKIILQKSDITKKDEVKQVIKFSKDKERELVQELQSAKFKYNELVDFVMGEDELEKMYIKKLLNHKKYENVGFGQGSNNNEGKANNNKNNNNNNKKQSQDINSRITFKASSSTRNKQSRTRINKTIDSKHASKQMQQQHSQVSTRNQQSLVYQERIQLLKQKLLHRQQQIQRLQTVLRHNGPNLTKVMTQFSYQQQQQQYKQLQERIQLLEVENHDVKTQLQKTKNNGGRYQALIEEVGKAHAVISQLRKENSLVKRLHKQGQFDLGNQVKFVNKSVNSAQFVQNQLRATKFSDDLTIDQLRKKVNFYEQQLALRGRENNINANGNGNQHQHQHSRSTKKLHKKSTKTTTKSRDQKHKENHTIKEAQTKQSPISKQKKTIKYKRDQTNKGAQRQKYQDQIKSSSLTNHKNRYQQPRHKAEKQGTRKQVKKLRISQIIEEEEQDESYVKQQREFRQEGRVVDDRGEVRQQQKQQQQQGGKGDQEDNENRDEQQISQPQQQEGNNSEQEEEDSSQQHEEEQVQGEERNQTMIQQYEQTINQLSSRCLQLKEQLDYKKQTIKGLQEIANRLINNQQQQNNIHTNQDQTPSQTIHHLTHQVQTLSSLLNESQFQKQQLRRQLIKIQTLYKEVRSKTQQPQIESINNEQEIEQLKKMIEQKDNKISDMRSDNNTIQDQLLNALDRIRRLNDQVDVVRQENDQLIKEIDQVRKQNQITKNDNESVRKQNDSVKKQNDSVKKQKDSVRKQNDSVKKQNDSVKKQNDSVKKEIDQVRKQNQITKNDNDSVKKQNDSVRKQNETIKMQHAKIIYQLNLNQSRLQQAALLLKQQRQRHSSTLQLSQLQKDQIITLRKNLFTTETKINQLQQHVQSLKEQNQRLVHQLN